MTKSAEFYSGVLSGIATGIDRGGGIVDRDGIVRDLRGAADKLDALAEAVRSMVTVADNLADEGDRVYLGSTNHADIIRGIRDAWWRDVEYEDDQELDKIVEAVESATPEAVAKLAASNDQIEASLKRMDAVEEEASKKIIDERKGQR